MKNVFLTLCLLLISATSVSASSVAGPIPSVNEGGNTRYFNDSWGMSYLIQPNYMRISENRPNFVSYNIGFGKIRDPFTGRFLIDAGQVSPVRWVEVHNQILTIENRPLIGYGYGEFQASIEFSSNEAAETFKGQILNGSLYGATITVKARPGKASNYKDVRILDKQFESFISRDGTVFIPRQNGVHRFLFNCLRLMGDII